MKNKKETNKEKFTLINNKETNKSQKFYPHKIVQLVLLYDPHFNPKIPRCA